MPPSKPPVIQSLKSVGRESEEDEEHEPRRRPRLGPRFLASSLSLLLLLLFRRESIHVAAPETKERNPVFELLNQRHTHFLASHRARTLLLLD